jgi:hypothetical protein
VVRRRVMSRWRATPGAAVDPLGSFVWGEENAEERPRQKCADDAREACEDENGRLVTVFMLVTVSSLVLTCAWLGLTRGGIAWSDRGSERK